MRPLACTLLACLLWSGAEAVAGGPADVADLVPADAAAIVVLDVSALRQVSAFRRVVEGARPGDLLPALAPIAGEATGADALPPSTILFASGSLDPGARDLVAAIRLDAPSQPVAEAMRTALERFGPVDDAGSHERSGFHARALDERTWVAGTPSRVQAAAQPVNVARIELPDADGAVAVAHFSGSALERPEGAPDIGTFTVWLALEPDVRLRIDIGCAPEDAERVENELRTTLTRALALPQLVALAPGPLPTPEVQRIGHGVRVELVVPPATWEALVLTATSAVQSELR